MRESLDMKSHGGQRTTLQRLKKVKSLSLVQTKKPLVLEGRTDMGKSLLKQFQGLDGRHLIDALIAQPLVRDKDLAALVAAAEAGRGASRDESHSAGCVGHRPLSDSGRRVFGCDRRAHRGPQESRRARR